MKFKKGDIVEVIKEDYCGGKVYEVGSRWEVFHEDTNNKGKPWDIVFVKDDARTNKQAVLYTNSVKKVEEDKPEEYKPEELMIPVSLVYQVLASEPTNREIKAFLKGYTEGLNK